MFLIDFYCCQHTGRNFSRTMFCIDDFWGLSTNSSEMTKEQRIIFSDWSKGIII